jgi:hypothetical protein
MKGFAPPLIILVACVALHLAGGRQATAALAGITTDGFDVALGIAYVVAWLATVLVAPPLAIARLVLVIRGTRA